MTTGTRIGDIYDMKVDPDGKVRIQKNEAKRLARLPVNQRIAARKTAETKQRFVSRGKASA